MNFCRLHMQKYVCALHILLAKRWSPNANFTDSKLHRQQTLPTKNEKRKECWLKTTSKSRMITPKKKWLKLVQVFFLEIKCLPVTIAYRLSKHIKPVCLCICKPLALFNFIHTISHATPPPCNICLEQAMDELPELLAHVRRKPHLRKREEYFHHKQASRGAGKCSWKTFKIKMAGPNILILGKKMP